MEPKIMRVEDQKPQLKRFNDFRNDGRIRSLDDSKASKIREVCRLQEPEEVWGVLYSIESCPDGGIIAIIGKISIWLPQALQSRLQGLQGRKIAILRLDGYHVRNLDGVEHV
jgi:hypothetical protein